MARTFWPKRPEQLSPVEAAAILQRQKGFAGYSLIRDNESGSTDLGHEIFCPYCGTGIASVNVSFLPPQEPEPGSRMSLLLSLAKTANAAEEKKRSVAPTAPTPVVALK